MRKGYTRVDWNTASNLDVKGLDLLTYELIASLSRSKGGWMQMELQGMAEIYNVSERSIVTSLQRLINRGLIEKIQGKGVSANRYRPTASTEETSGLEKQHNNKNFRTSTEENSGAYRRNFRTSTEETSPITNKTDKQHKEIYSIQEVDL